MRKIPAESRLYQKDNAIQGFWKPFSVFRTLFFMAEVLNYYHTLIPNKISAMSCAGILTRRQCLPSACRLAQAKTSSPPSRSLYPCSLPIAYLIIDIIIWPLLLKKNSPSTKINLNSVKRKWSKWAKGKGENIEWA